MAARKVTITIDEDVLATLRALAAQEGVPLSTYVTRIAEHHARVQNGLAAMREWEDEHGASTPEELAEAEADIARTKARAHDPCRSTREPASPRERFARAGVLEVPDPVASRPAPNVVAEARRELSGGLRAAKTRPI